MFPAQRPRQTVIRVPVTMGIDNIAWNMDDIPESIYRTPSRFRQAGFSIDRIEKPAHGDVFSHTIGKLWPSLRKSESLVTRVALFSIASAAAKLST